MATFVPARRPSSRTAHEHHESTVSDIGRVVDPVGYGIGSVAGDTGGGADHASSGREFWRPVVLAVFRRTARTGWIQRLRRHPRVLRRPCAALGARASAVHTGRASDD